MAAARTRSLVALLKETLSLPLRIRETLDWETLPAEMNPETGYIRVAVPSADGSGEMKFFCSVFGAPDSDKTETHVSFILF